METMAFETSYGVLDDTILSKESGSSTEGNPPSSIHAKPSSGWQIGSWEEAENE